MQSKSKIQTRPIEDFIGRVRTLRNKNEKELRIPIRDAQQLSDSLSQVMTRLVTVQDDIIEALKTAQQASTVNVEMDEGNFSKK